MKRPFISSQIALSLICIIGFMITFLSFGWMMVLFGIGFILCLILQLILIWRSTPVYPQMSVPIVITSLVFFVCCLFREDFSSAHKSTSSPFNTILYFLGYREERFYEHSSDIGGLLNFVFGAILIVQFVLLIDLKKRKKALAN